MPFFLRGITLGNGDTLSGSKGGLGPRGLFSASAANAVPEPATLLLSCVALAAAAATRRRKTTRA